MCKSCRTCFMFYCMFYYTCDRSFSGALLSKDRRRELTCDCFSDCVAGYSFCDTQRPIIMEATGGVHPPKDQHADSLLFGLTWYTFSVKFHRLMLYICNTRTWMPYFGISIAIFNKISPYFVQYQSIQSCAIAVIHWLIVPNTGVIQKIFFPEETLDLKWQSMDWSMGRGVIPPQPRGRGEQNDF